MPTPVYVREDEFFISVTVNGVVNAGQYPWNTSWQTKEGGDVQANVVKTHPGGMLGEIALGGPGSRSDATVKRLYTEDIHSFVPALEAAAGNARMSISWTPLNPDSSQGGRGQVITGYLKEVAVPNYDANASAAAVVGLVMTCDQFQQGAGG